MGMTNASARSGKPDPTTPDPEGKRCPKCERRLTHASFYRDFYRPDSLATYCKLCHRGMVRAHQRAVAARNRAAFAAEQKSGAKE